MTRYIDLLGAVFIAYAVLELMGVALIGVVALAMGGLSGLGVSSGDMELVLMGGIYGVAMLVAALFELVFAVAKLLVGTGLRRRAPWSRLGGIIMGCVGLFNVPLGTALGVFAIAVLIDKDVQAEFDS